MDDYLAELYYTPNKPANFSNPHKLYDVVKAEGRYPITLKYIKNWLKSQETYTLNRRTVRPKPHSRVVVEGLDSQWDCDLGDMQSLAKYNGGIRFLLLAIDIFSRYVWVQPLKNKTGQEVAKALTEIFKEGRQPKHILRVDRGSEFSNRYVRGLLQRYHIHLMLTNNLTKANYAERGLKTIKSKIFRYMMSKQTHKYVDVLQDLVKAYNNTKHSSLGRPPSQVNEENEGEVRLDQYLLRKKEQPKKQKYKFQVGDTVRISHLKTTFQREYQQKWTGELFKITKRYKRNGIPVYNLQDWSGEDIKGSFYQQELQAVHVDENTLFKVEKVLKRRTRNGEREAFVKWLHWPKKYNSWIPARDLQNL